MVNGHKWLVNLACMTAFMAATPAWAQTPEKETNCSDRIDEDQDTVTDCADADCYDAPECKSGGGTETNDVLCSDFIDNDGDGAIDCEDVDCMRQGVNVCKGSWQGSLSGTGAATPPNGQTNANTGDTPTLAEGQNFEDLIGTGGDIDGERNDFVCADGIDNDGDGRTDCADFGCRFDPSVGVCQGNPSLRFSLAAHARLSYDPDPEDNDGDGEDANHFSAQFNRLQLRAFGPIPFIQDSFFLLSFRVDGAPRLSFANFTVPISGAHRVSLNSGGGGLSDRLVLSVSKELMLDKPFYLFNAFEQGSSFALGAEGPIIPSYRLGYRAFVTTGSGALLGRVGGRSLSDEERNFTWGFGAQVALYAIGRFDRWDTRYLYTEVPPSVTLIVGGRYDQRDFERYAAANAAVFARWWRFTGSAESYMKREFEFKSWGVSWNATIGFLIIPKWLLIAADIGGFNSSEFQNVNDLPAQLPFELRTQTDELQIRGVLHTYVWRNTGLVSLYFSHQLEEEERGSDVTVKTTELRVEAQVRF